MSEGAREDTAKDKAKNLINLRLWWWGLLHGVRRWIFFLPLPGPLVLLQLSHDARRIRQPEYAGQRAASRVLRVQDTFAQTRGLVRRRREPNRRPRVAVRVVAVPMTHESAPVPRFVAWHLVLRRVVTVNARTFLQVSLPRVHCRLGRMMG